MKTETTENVVPVVLSTNGLIHKHLSQALGILHTLRDPYTIYKKNVLSEWCITNITTF